MAASTDPRMYVKRVPLPIASQTGIKIQARSMAVYTPSRPTRDDVRLENFKRRHQQLMFQGFQAINYKPYHGIGDPFYLDERRLILNALGQLEEHEYENENVSSLSCDDEFQEKVQPAEALSKPLEVAKMLLWKTCKKLNNLNKEIVWGRNLVRSVSLGRGLFHIIQDEDNAKKTAAEHEMEKKVEKSRCEWTIPTAESSSEDESEEVKQSTDLSSSTRCGSSYASKHHRKKTSAGARPYTPQHNNLTSCPEDISGHSLFRQLCALHWLLEAMSGESAITLCRIHSCWKLKEIGNYKLVGRRSQKHKWDQFVNSSCSNKPYLSGKQMNIMRGIKYHGVRQVSTSHRNSTISLTSSSTAPVQDSVRVSVSGTEEPISVAAAELSDEENLQSAKYLFPYLYEDSNENNKNAKILVDNIPRSCREMKKDKRLDELDRKRTKKIVKMTTQRMEAQDEETHCLRSAKSNHIRPNSSPNFQALLPNNKYVNLTSNLRQKFVEVKEDKAFTLHDVLEQLEKDRLLVCQTKFLAMTVVHQSHHKALEDMRLKSAAVMNKANEKHLTPEGNWFSELKRTIPSHLRKLWYYQKILNTLSKSDSVKSSNKHSAYKFLKVLAGLREWEICSPDISAAIEFCREKIIKMAIEEYEEWFIHQFPGILRPQSLLPPAEVSRKRGNSHTAKL